MNQKVIEYKESLLLRGGFRRVSATQYRTQHCPICGDHKWHCYIKIDVTNDEPVLYHCFKCNASGIVGDKFLEFMGIDDINVPKFKYGRKLTVSETVSDKIVNGDSVCDKDDISGVCNYIQSRVGVYPTLDDLVKFNYIGNVNKYVTDFLGNEKGNILNNRYWFRLTNGNIIGRYHDDSIDYRWKKFDSDKIKTPGIYKLNVPVDLYQPVNVVICEGIMDIIGLYYNHKSMKNCVYIAVLGRDYNRAIKYVIDRGIFGNSVNIRIFKDSDVDKIYIDYNIKKLFKRIDIYQNMSGKDYGLPTEQIDIQRIIK